MTKTVEEADQKMTDRQCFDYKDENGRQAAEKKESHSPEEFRPERFLRGRNAKIDPRGNDFELIPFGAGRRICAGTRMGIVLVEYILGTLVHSFDWKMPDGVEINMDEAFGLALQKAVSLSAMVTTRLDHNA